MNKEATTRLTRAMRVKKKKLYVHIGMPKTGSSAIQALLVLNPQLLANHGISYPWQTEFGQEFQTSAGNASHLHQWIVQSEHEQFERALKEIESEKIILSSEVLFQSARLAPQLFAQFFSRYDLKIICYIRRIDDLLESCINQLVKADGWTDYSDLSIIINDHDYASTLTKLADFIPLGNIMVRPYAKNRFLGGSIYRDFLNCIGFGIADVSVTLPGRHVNPSLNRDAFEFRRALNSIRGLNSDGDLKNKINGLLAQYSVELVDSKKNILTSSERVKVLEQYSERMANFTKLFFPDQVELFENTKTSVVGHDALDTVIIADILRSVFFTSPDVIYKIFDALLRSKSSEVIYYPKIVSAITNNFLPSVLTYYADAAGEKGIVDSGIFKYFSSFSCQDVRTATTHGGQVT